MKDFEEQKKEVNNYFDLCRKQLKAKKNLVENLEQAVLYYKVTLQDATKVAKVIKQISKLFFLD